MKCRLWQQGWSALGAMYYQKPFCGENCKWCHQIDKLKLLLDHFEFGIASAKTLVVMVPKIIVMGKIGLWMVGTQCNIEVL